MLTTTKKPKSIICFVFFSALSKFVKTRLNGSGRLEHPREMYLIQISSLRIMRMKIYWTEFRRKQIQLMTFLNMVMNLNILIFDINHLLTK